MRRGTRLLAASSVVFTAAVAYQRSSETRDRQRYPPPGQMIDIGGRSIHLEVRGQGAPVLVMETGAGVLGSSWGGIVDELAEITTVVTYDRAGYGWSDPPATGTRVGRAVAEDLHHALGGAGVAGPYVLLGHSLGGLYVRAFAARYPTEVVGLVLVDATHENMLPRLRRSLGLPAIVALIVSQLMFAAVPRSLSRVALELGLGHKPARALVGGENDEEFEMRRALYLRSAFRRASLGEIFGIPATSQELRRRPALGDVPLAVVTAADPPGTDRSLIARIRPLWLELQADLAALSSRSEHVVAATGGHHVYHDDPAAVVAATQRVVDTARGD